AYLETSTSSWYLLQSYRYPQPGWDWQVSLEANNVVVKRAQPGTNRFRKVPNRTFGSFANAFSYVEEQ
ncbi:MAG: hypothetical protein WB755_02035, partial [Terriglobales bacterium]